MGQYYTPYTFYDNQWEAIGYSLSPIEAKKLNGKDSWKYFNGAKLMEHSYSGNHLINYISSVLYRAPTRLIWFGDYADSASNGSSCSRITPEYLKRIKDAVVDDDWTASENLSFSYEGMYFVNHERKIGFPMDRFTYNGKHLIVSPIPLLTAVGNGLGGGDFYGDFSEGQAYKVGEWAFELVSLEDELPAGYTEVPPAVFTEK